MLAARHQTQAKARFIKNDIRRGQQNQRYDHKPVALKGANVEKELALCLRIADDRGNVVRVGGGIHRLDNDRGGGDAEHVERRTDDRLVRLEVDARHGQKAGIHKAERRRRQQDQQDQAERRSGGRKKPHDQRAAERAHDHDALQTEIDNAGMLGEASAERHKDQDRGKDQSILNEKCHCFAPPSAAAAACFAAFSSRLAMRAFINCFMKRTNPQR